MLENRMVVDSEWIEEGYRTRHENLFQRQARALKEIEEEEKYEPIRDR